MVKNQTIVESLLAELGIETSALSYLKHKRKWPIGLKLQVALSKKYEKHFFYLTFSILGKFAASEGRVQPWQYNVLEDFMANELNLSSGQKATAFRILRESRNLEVSFEQLIQGYLKTFGRTRRMLEHLVEVLLDIALADERYTNIEKTYIRIVIQEFGITKSEYTTIRKRQVLLKKLKKQNLEQGPASRKIRDKEQSTSNQLNPNTDLSSPYLILGITPKDSVQKIKQSYRKLAMRYHPDRLRSSGLSAEFLKRATLNFQEIQTAYETICRERGI